MVPDYVAAALTEPADDSEVFTMEVGRLKNLLEGRTHLLFEHYSNMMYNSGQRLDAFLDKSFASVARLSKSMHYDMAIFISSKGKFFYMAINELAKPIADKDRGRSTRHWIRLELEETPEVIRKVVVVCSDELALQGYRELGDCPGSLNGRLVGCSVSTEFGKVRRIGAHRAPYKVPVSQIRRRTASGLTGEIPPVSSVVGGRITRESSADRRLIPSG